MFSLNQFEKSIKENKPIYLENENLYFGDMKIAKDTEISDLSDRNNKKYTVLEVWNFLKNIDLRHSEYLKSSKEDGIALLHVLDQKTLLEKLNIIKKKDKNTFEPNFFEK
jgi:hypothetical protein